MDAFRFDWFICVCQAHSMWIHKSNFRMLSQSDAFGSWMTPNKGAVFNWLKMILKMWNYKWDQSEIKWNLMIWIRILNDRWNECVRKGSSIVCRMENNQNIRNEKVLYVFRLPDRTLSQSVSVIVQISQKNEDNKSDHKRGWNSITEVDLKFRSEYQILRNQLNSNRSRRWTLSNGQSIGLWPVRIS